MGISLSSRRSKAASNTSTTRNTSSIAATALSSSPPLSGGTIGFTGLSHPHKFKAFRKAQQVRSEELTVDSIHFVPTSTTSTSSSVNPNWSHSEPGTLADRNFPNRTSASVRQVGAVNSIGESRTGTMNYHQYNGNINSVVSTRGHFETNKRTKYPGQILSSGQMGNYSDSTRRYLLGLSTNATVEKSSTDDIRMANGSSMRSDMVNLGVRSTQAASGNTVSSHHMRPSPSKPSHQSSFKSIRKSLHSTFKDPSHGSTVIAHSYRPVDDSIGSGRQVIALYDYNSSGKDDLPFKKGDHLLVIDDRHEDWWYARNVYTHESGFIPQSYVADINDLKIQEWYYDKLSLREAERLLDQSFNCAGTFLIRPSGSTPGNYALSMLDVQSDGQTQVKHYRVQRSSDGRYFIGPKAAFASLPALVEYYSAKSEGLCSRLLKACPKHKPTLRDLSFNDLNQIEIERKSIKLISLIGSGNYGEVWKGKCRGLDVAVKTMKAHRQSTQRGDFLDEARVMKDLQHPNIVRLYGVSTISEPLYIVFEYLMNGNLLDYLHSDMGQALKLPKIVDVAAQVASGMAYLEKKHLVHCDLAARNILVGEALLVKIGDFGLAKVIRTGKLQVESQTQFPIKWTAPEAATKKEYTIKSDVWSFGIFLYELITRGSVPYPGMSNQETLKAVSEGDRLSRPHMCPDSFYQVMMSCWNANPDMRPTFEHLYNLFDDFFITTEPNYRESDDL